MSNFQTCTIRHYDFVSTKITRAKVQVVKVIGYVVYGVKVRIPAVAVVREAVWSSHHCSHARVS